MLKLSITRSSIYSAIILFFPMILGSSCDCQRKKQCEWLLAIDEENMDIASPGYTSLCLKNFKLGKQKCFLEIETSRLDQINGMSFRYDDIEIEGTTMPRRIKEISTCSMTNEL